MKTNRIHSNNLRTIRRRFPRFCSLMVMSFLGVFVFAGLTATAPDMILTLDKYLDSHQVYDLQVVSDMGLEEADVAAIASLEGVKAAEGTKSLDVKALYHDDDAVIKITAMPQQINRIDLLKGRLPEQADEIVVEENFLEKEKLNLGDQIRLEGEHLSTTSVIIVGTVNSALYYSNVMINQSRGNTSIGSGIIDYYAYGTEALFDLDVFTAVDLIATGASEAVTSSEDYLVKVDLVKEELEKIQNEREQARYESIYSEAADVLEEVRQSSNEALNKSLARLQDAKAELDNSRQALDAAKDRLETAEKTLAESKIRLDEGKSQLEAIKALYGEDSPVYQKGLAELQKSQAEYEAGMAEYRANWQAHQDGEAAYAQGFETYTAGMAAYQKAKNEVQQQLDKGQDELNAIQKPTWYIEDRTGSATYNDYIDDSNSIRNLAVLFPIVFFAVAVLVSLISMNRMVEEDRLEIGTMKSMGFSEWMIMSKYLTFSILATFIGGATGALSGLAVIPELIFYIYRILFTLPDLTLSFQPLTTGLGFCLTVICVCGTGVLTVWNVLREKPAALLRPKPPKKGKCILLEHFPVLWNRMRFSKKVTARNIFRYKKRVLVTIGGIAGCTALMLTGFGVKDAIADVPAAQYYGIYQFDATAYVSDISNQGEIIDKFLQFSQVKAAIPAQRMTADLEGINGFLQVVTDQKALLQIAALKDATTGEDLTLETGRVIINEKLAAMKDLKVGDPITLVDVEDRKMTFEIGGIAQNYIEHFVMVDAQTYQAMGYDFKPNLIFLQTEALDQKSQTTLASDILKDNCVLNLTWRDTLIEKVENSLQSLNAVVLILIVLSALLAFVVLYNLSNININERRREIASLKVLGFYDKEVDRYITGETILLTAIGIGLGLILGIFLSHAVVSTIEVEKCRFMNTLKPFSYLWSALTAAAFTLIVNLITHFNLKKINMIDSLKSVE